MEGVEGGFGGAKGGERCGETVEGDDRGALIIMGGDDHSGSGER